MLDTSKIYTSKKCGDFKVIKYKNSVDVIVEFITTGYRARTQTAHIIRGTVKDKLSPIVFGVGFVGVGDHTACVNKKATKKYAVWQSMIGRCYDASYQEKAPTYIGCSVCLEWHNFQNFAKWFDENYIDDYQLDKDIKVKGNKIYSPATCLFVSPAENIIDAHAKCYTFTNPKGEFVNIYNLTEFCRVNNLNVGNMCAISNEKRRAHKGWTKG